MKLTVEYLDYPASTYDFEVPEDAKLHQRNNDGAGMVEFVVADAEGKVLDSVSVNVRLAASWRLQDESVREPVAA